MSQGFRPLSRLIGGYTSFENINKINVIGFPAPLEVDRELYMILDGGMNTLTVLSFRPLPK